jgi:hypothetical protein
MYAGQEAEPGRYEAKVHLLESELAAGADPATLMTERFRRRVHKFLPKTEDSDIMGLTPLMDLDTYQQLAEMAQNPFNAQAIELYTEFLKRGARQGEAVLQATGIVSLDKTIQDLRARGVDDVYGAIEH